jgi:hypothetical protein
LAKKKKASWNVRARHDPKKWAMVVLHNLRYRAKAKGIKFDLKPEDLELPEVCPVLGIKLRIAFGRAANKPYSPSVDRFDNSKGYVKGNVRVISRRANSLKTNATVHELKQVIRYMEGKV